MADLPDDPIMFLDVDGTLIPFRARPDQLATVSRDAARLTDEVSGNPLVDRLDPADGGRLLALGCRLVWATTWMAGRTFVWLDDEITDTDRQWVRAHHPARALLHRVDPFVGLTDDDLARIRQWLAAR